MISKNERGGGFRASVSSIHSDFQTMLRKLLTLFALLLPLGAHAANPQVEVKTNLGSLTVELYPDKAPKTVEKRMRTSDERRAKARSSGSFRMSALRGAASDARK